MESQLWRLQSESWAIDSISLEISPSTRYNDDIETQSQDFARSASSSPAIVGQDDFDFPYCLNCNEECPS